MDLTLLFTDSVCGQHDFSHFVSDHPVSLAWVLLFFKLRFVKTGQQHWMRRLV
jgi:hypothetical protein